MQGVSVSKIRMHPQPVVAELLLGCEKEVGSQKSEVRRSILGEFFAFLASEFSFPEILPKKNPDEPGCVVLAIFNSI